MEDLQSIVEAHLGARHKLVREVGSGGMATVFLATDTKHRRDVAIKVLRPEVASAVGAERFLREIETVARLTHPHILPLHDSGRLGDLLYYSMPYVDGESLRSRLDRESALPISDAVEIAVECADALAHAHAQGVLHRDVKPGNILLSGSHAVLADFGIARALEEASSQPLTSTGIVVGTLGYMAPEQVSGEGSVDARSDVYALGCVLYEMLTGEPPFEGRSRMAVVARQLTGPPTPASALRPEVPADLEEIVDRCLARTPADRFGSAGELRDALVAIRGGASLKARKTRITSRPRWQKAIGGMAIMAVLAAGGWLLFPLVGGPPRALDRAKILVFPLANRGGGENAGADVALMIGNALVHTDPLRWIDGWEHLTPSQRANPAGLTSANFQAIARERRAGHYITGGLAWSGDSVTVRLVLHDTQGDSITGQASAAGSSTASSPDQLGLQAVLQLLPSLVDPGRVVDLSPISDRAPAAVALWIQGDRAYRNARFSEALELYRRAVALDSLLTLAALKGASAANWLERPDLAADLVGLAVRDDTVLPPPFRAFAQGLFAYQVGAADEAVAQYRAALALDPEWPEAWTALGETYRHLLPVDAVTEEFGTPAFARAERLDSTFTPALVHLAEAAVLNGDLERARRLLTRIEAAGAELGAFDWVVLMESCAAPPRTRDQVPRAPSASLIYASQQFAAGARHLRCAETGFRGVLDREDLSRGEHWSAVVGLMGVLTLEGREAELDSLLQESLASGEGSTRFLFALGVAAGADLQARAATVDAEAAALWAPDYEQPGPSTLWLLTLWNAMEGDLPVARTLVDRLAVVAGEADDPLAPVLARAGRAHLLAAEGDSATALEVLRGLDPAVAPDVLDYALVEPLAPERLLLAELLLGAGDAEQAYRTAAVLDHPGAAIFVPFVARSLELRARAAEALPGRDWEHRGQAARNRLQTLGRQDLIRRQGIP